MSDPVRLAVLGDPLEFTRSPELHRAGLAAIGLDCESRALRTAPGDLDRRLRELAGEGLRGVNLTHPLKELACERVTRLSIDARRARSVNTVGFSDEGSWGDTTDGSGFLDLLYSLSREPGDQRAVVLGAGGAARSVALALTDAGAPPPVLSSRHPEVALERLNDVPATAVAWRSREEREALARATLVVNATPLTAPEEIALPSWMAAGTLVVDLVYGATLTLWVEHARRAKLEAFDGLGLLVFQARRSLALWTGREVPADVLMRVVGWPR
ncbi:MAG: shikimate dehydrogenase [Candidatus Eisenbacteria bacterium]|nr:shikimate dehydrogenase [Candidatus Eisenbacteria bacterium]